MNFAAEFALSVDGRPNMGTSEINLLEEFLDGIAESFRSGDAFDTLYALKDELTAIRNSVETAVWNEIRKAVIKHPLRHLVHQDPFTRRAFEKPRGYPGDAVILDFIYGSDNIAGAVREATPLGVQIYQACHTVPTCRAVRRRRDMIVDMIDEMAANRSGLSVMSIACGHLRESALSSGLREGRIKKFIAIDQDEASIEYVKSISGNLPVVPVVGSATSIISGDLSFEDVDFIYSAGLYDYLSDRAAIELTRALYSMLKPGGSLLIGNFLPQLADTGYMETYMGWKLIYRSEADMERIASEAVPDSAGREVFVDPPDCLVFARIYK